MKQILLATALATTPLLSLAAQADQSRVLFENQSWVGVQKVVYIPTPDGDGACGLVFDSKDKGVVTFMATSRGQSTLITHPEIDASEETLVKGEFFLEGPRTFKGTKFDQGRVWLPIGMQEWFSLNNMVATNNGKTIALPHVSQFTLSSQAVEVFTACAPVVRQA